jgi:hypothetical protein
MAELGSIANYSEYLVAILQEHLGKHSCTRANVRDYGRWRQPTVFSQQTENLARVTKTVTAVCINAASEPRCIVTT